MKETVMENKRKKALGAKKYISKSLDNKQKTTKKKTKTLLKQTIDELRNSFYGKTVEDPIEVESTRSEKLDYEILEFQNYNKDKKFSFKCYDSNHLKIPKTHTNKLISRTCDDDCSTDDEQITYAINKLYDSLKSEATERKKFKFLRRSK